MFVDIPTAINFNKAVKAENGDTFVVDEVSHQIYKLTELQPCEVEATIMYEMMKGYIVKQ